MSAMATDVQGQDVAINVKGLSTGAWVRVLNSSSVIFEKSTVLYDAKGRVIRTYKTGIPRKKWTIFYRNSNL